MYIKSVDDHIAFQYANDASLNYFIPYLADVILE